jgi:hypothetical protein
MSTKENKAIVRRFLEEVVNKGNQTVADELVASDFIDHNPLPGLSLPMWVSSNPSLSFALPSPT